MNIKFRKMALFRCFPVFLLVLFSCGKKPDGNVNAGRGGTATMTIPNEARVVAVAKDFVRIYQKEKSAEGFLTQADDMMSGDFSPRFNIHQNRWYVFFTDGMDSLTVTMNKDLTAGTVRGLNAKVVTSQAGAAGAEGDDREVPLFTLPEFEKMVDLPHNR